MKRTKIRCEYCGREISKSNYSKHIRSHENGNYEKYLNMCHVDHDDLFCKFCNKEYKNKKSLSQHEIRCKNNPNRKLDNVGKNNGMFNKKAWCNGLTKYTDERILKSSKKLSESTKGRKGKPHTAETKEKISKSRRIYLMEHPEKVPYLLNHSSKMSYPEEYFKEFFEKENIDLKYHLQVGIYQLDFYNEEHKLDVEIDGEQHYHDKRIVESDKRRNEYLSNNGWKIIRIRWAEFTKMSLLEKKDVINKIKNELNS